LGLFGRIYFEGRRRVGEPAVGLEALQLMEGAVEGALGTGLVATKSGEGIGVRVEDVGQFLGLVVVIEELLIVVLQVEEADFEEAGFDSAEAGELPLGHDDLVDEGGFEGAVGLELFEEGDPEFFEILILFANDDRVFGGEAMLEGIEADGGLAFGGFGAGAQLGVAAIGVDLLFGGHDLRLLTRKVSAGWQAPFMIKDGVWDAPGA
jgi:hypothetical protein